MSSDWIERTDSKTGKVYYKNVITQEKTWKKPVVLSSSSPPPPPPPPTPFSNGEWVEKFDKSRGKPYFVNTVTKEKTWTIPGEQTGSAAATPPTNPASAWIEKIDRTKGKPYYSNIITGEKKWKLGDGESIALAPPLPPPTSLPQPTIAAPEVSPRPFSSPPPPPPPPPPPYPLSSPTATVNSTNDADNGWVEKLDPNRNKVYYVNTKTKEKVWKLPSNATLVTTSSTSSLAVAADTAASSWIEKRDMRGGKFKPFYVNVATGERVWKLPEGGRIVETKKDIGGGQEEGKKDEGTEKVSLLMSADKSSAIATPTKRVNFEDAGKDVESWVECAVAVKEYWGLEKKSYWRSTTTGKIVWFPPLLLVEGINYSTSAEPIGLKDFCGILASVEWLTTPSSQKEENNFSSTSSFAASIPSSSSSSSASTPVKTNASSHWSLLRNTLSAIKIGKAGKEEEKADTRDSDDEDSVARKEKEKDKRESVFSMVNPLRSNAGKDAGKKNGKRKQNDGEKEDDAEKSGGEEEKEKERETEEGKRGPGVIGCYMIKKKGKQGVNPSHDVFENIGNCFTTNEIIYSQITAYNLHFVPAKKSNKQVHKVVTFI